MSEGKILLIYTGGTIGMMEDLNSGDLKPLDFNQLSVHIPELKRFHLRIDTYTFPPIDSSNSSIQLWVQLINLIKENYHQYDGFVILHGTDTIAYTASALSFMIENLQKPIILTGSQLPIGVLRTDGKENIISAIQIAAEKDEQGTFMIQEVAIYFEYKLYRGNRSIKYSANHFDAIRSPNYPPLAEAGVNIEYNKAFLWRNSHHQTEIKTYTQICNQIVVLHLFPGIDFDLVKKQFSDIDIKALILRTYGSGNSPTDPKFLNWIKQIIDKDIIVVNVTQCIQGEVELGKYETSRYLKELGVISAHDMTFEASITKLMFLLGYYDIQTSKILFEKNLRGEISR